MVNATFHDNPHFVIRFTLGKRFKIREKEESERNLPWLTLAEMITEMNVTLVNSNVLDTIMFIIF